MERNILTIIIDYENKIKKVSNSEEMKTLVREMYSDSELDDISFDELIYDKVIPRLKQLGFNMEYDWETNETNYERVIKENY